MEPDQVLSRLTSEEFGDSIGFVLPPAPMRRVLQQSLEVQHLEAALRHGAVAPEQVRRFVAKLLADFRHGELFRHDLALAALAVAMEHWSNPFAEEYLIDLARVERPEFRASYRVAGECLKARYALPSTQVRSFRYPSSSGSGTRPERSMRVLPSVRPVERTGICHGWLRYPEVSHAST